MLSESDRQGIEHVRTALREAILGGDAEAYAACYTADGFVMHQDTPYVQGTAAIKEHTQEIFDVLRVTKLDLTPVVVNGDGWPDILLTPFQPDGALLLNSGGDAFLSVNLPSRAGGSLVDADGDGKLDYLYPGHAPGGGDPGVPPRLWYQR
ncbi:MAG: hypothetical protein IH965_08415 [Gemmatimonadetes bacterium]|nr:hypothetical protein [Gemmatimonadota bacterium]